MLRIAVCCLLCSFSIAAPAAYKCESAGQVVYSDVRCSGTKTSIVDTSASASSADAAQARDLAANEKKEATRLANERRKREAQEEKQLRRDDARRAAKQKKCATLALRKKWSADEVSHASSRARAKAERKAQKLAEQYALECDK